MGRDHNLIFGYSHPAGDPEPGNYTLTDAEIRRYAKEVAGLPVLAEHLSVDEFGGSDAEARAALQQSGRTIGRVLTGLRAADGRFKMVIRIDDQDAWNDVQSGERAGLSLGISHLRDRSIERIVGRTLMEVSVVDKGDLPDTEISGWMTINDDDLRAYDDMARAVSASIQAAENKAVSAGDGESGNAYTEQDTPCAAAHPIQRELTVARAMSSTPAMSHAEIAALVKQYMADQQEQQKADAPPTLQQYGQSVAENAVADMIMGNGSATPAQPAQPSQMDQLAAERQRLDEERAAFARDQSAAMEAVNKVLANQERLDREAAEQEQERQVATEEQKKQEERAALEQEIRAKILAEQREQQQPAAAAEESAEQQLAGGKRGREQDHEMANTIDENASAMRQVMGQVEDATQNRDTMAMREVAIKLLQQGADQTPELKDTLDCISEVIRNAGTTVGIEKAGSLMRELSVARASTRTRYEQTVTEKQRQLEAGRRQLQTLEQRAIAAEQEAQKSKRENLALLKAFTNGAAPMNAPAAAPAPAPTQQQMHSQQQQAMSLGSGSAPQQQQQPQQVYTKFGRLVQEGETDMPLTINDFVTGLHTKATNNQLAHLPDHDRRNLAGLSGVRHMAFHNPDKWEAAHRRGMGKNVMDSKDLGLPPQAAAIRAAAKQGLGGMTVLPDDMRGSINVHDGVHLPTGF